MALPVIICILNYNNGANTIRCLESIFAQTNRAYRILIIDNHSTDDSVEVLALFLERIGKNIERIIANTHLPSNPPSFETITLLLADRNGGYAYGNNLGIRWAQRMGGFSFILILNNDVTLKETFLDVMHERLQELQHLHQTKKIALGAIELGMDGTIHHEGFHFLHIPTGIVFPKPMYPSLPYLVGAALFLPIHVPLMDESYFLYFDDIQYSQNLKKEGYFIETATNATYFHEPGGSILVHRQWVIFRSLVRFYAKNYPWLLPLVVPIRLLLIGYLAVKRLLRASL